MSNLPPCPECQQTDFFHIPDSLASACKNCGFVWVSFDGKVEKGKVEKGVPLHELLNSWIQTLDEQGNRKADEIFEGDK